MFAQQPTVYLFHKSPVLTVVFYFVHWRGDELLLLLLSCSPSEAESTLTFYSQDILRFSQNRKVSHRVHNGPLQVPTLSQKNPIHTLPLC